MKKFFKISAGTYIVGNIIKRTLPLFFSHFMYFHTLQRQRTKLSELFEKFTQLFLCNCMNIRTKIVRQFKQLYFIHFLHKNLQDKCKRMFTILPKIVKKQVWKLSTNNIKLYSIQNNIISKTVDNFNAKIFAFNTLIL